MALLLRGSRHAPYAIYRIALILIIILQFLILVFPTNARLRRTTTEKGRVILREIAIPEAAGDYYRKPGKFVVNEGENRWFGPEINSRVLCATTADAFNKTGFFDIIYTREDAEVWPSSTPGKVWWYRRQEWRFATANTPWRTDTVHIILVTEIGWEQIDPTDSITGFPWSGFEEHWREENIVKSKSEIIGYYRYEHEGEKYLTPKYYKHGTSSYFCATTQSQHNLTVLKHNQGHFTPPEFRLEVNRLSRREKGTPKDTDNWYDCIPLKKSEKHLR